MINNSYYSQDIVGPYDLHDIGNLELEEGDTRLLAATDQLSADPSLSHNNICSAWPRCCSGSARAAD